MKLRLLLIPVLFLLVPSVFAGNDITYSENPSDDPADYIFADFGDRMCNGTLCNTPAANDGLSTAWYTKVTDECIYTATDAKLGNMSIKCDGTSSLHGVEFHFGEGEDNVTYQISYYDDGGTSGELMALRLKTTAGNHLYTGFYDIISTTQYHYYWTGGDDTASGITVKQNDWVNITIHDAPDGSAVLYINGTLIYNTSFTGFYLVYLWAQNGKVAIYDNFLKWRGAPEDMPTTIPDSTPPEITFYNMTSEGGEGCINWNTNKDNACTTFDTTPTVYIETNENAYCAIYTSDYNYTNITNLGVNRSCYSEGLAKEHICTLTPQDELTPGDLQIYISCQDGDGNENLTSTSGGLALTILEKYEFCYDGIDNDDDGLIDDNDPDCPIYSLTQQLAACNLRLTILEQWLFFWNYQGQDENICDAIENECGPEIECNHDKDCGSPHWARTPYCKDPPMIGYVYDYFYTYDCINPKTTDSYCNEIIKDKIKEKCGKGETCENGECVKSCTDECNKREFGCEDENTKWNCELQSDGCYDKIYEDCDKGKICKKLKSKAICTRKGYKK